MTVSPCLHPRVFRRSRLTTAPRKRTFIASMLKCVIEVQTPAGLSDGSFQGGNAQVGTQPCCLYSTTDAVVAASPFLFDVDGGNGGDNHNNGFVSKFGGDDEGNQAGHGAADSTATFLLLAAAIGVGICANPVSATDFLTVEAPLAPRHMADPPMLPAAPDLDHPSAISTTSTDLLFYGGLAMLAARRIKAAGNIAGLMGKLVCVDGVRI